MDKHMKELFDQALDQAVPETYTTLTREQLAKFSEKFAELIVLECMEKVREEYVPVLEDTDMMKDPYWDGYVQCGVDSYIAVKLHFGVKE